MIEDVLRGIITGILVAFVVIYSLRPKTPYPKWILMSYEHPWLFVLAIAVAAWSLAWDRIIGALMFIIILTLILDYHMLGKRTISTRDNTVVNKSVDLSTPGTIGYLEADGEGPALDSIGLDSEVYPMFDTDVDTMFQPGHPSPF